MSSEQPDACGDDRHSCQHMQLLFAPLFEEASFSNPLHWCRIPFEAVLEELGGTHALVSTVTS